MASKTLLVLAAAQAAFAHFGLDFPERRGDTLSEDADPDFSQWMFPCANVDFDNGNITEWNGKAVNLELHHAYSYVWLNVGLGDNTTDFNITLTPEFWNVTGSGTVCVDDLPFPENIANGTIGTLQVVTTTSGSALYNCADFRYNSDAESPSNCSVPEEFDVIKIKSQSNDTGSDSEGGHGDHGDGGDEKESETEGSGDGNGGGDDEDAAGIISLNKATLTALVGVGFAAAMLGL